ncbi:uncharacterized protein [Arachis hypogaea]|nr:uncharacterized protein LOC112748297 [Arachis hypogaea]
MASANTPSETPSSQEQGSTPDASIGTQKNNNRAKTDHAWGHCKQVVESGKTILLCIYCEKLIRGGGIHWFKLHLAGKGGDVELVEREFDEIERNEMQQQQKSRVPTPNSRKGKQVKGLQFYFPSATTPGAQPTIKSILQSKEIVEKCDIAIAKWMVDASVPFNAVDSAYYQPMIDAIASMGAGYKGPSYPRVRGYLLSKLVEDMRKMVDSYREIWKQTGCTIMADGWTDRCRHTLIKFLVYCPKGTVFLKSIDASNISKTAENLFKLFRDVVLFVGPENVVHIVTDNAANYVAAGSGREILRPAPTRFATNFIALQSILAQKDPLRAMLTLSLVHVLRIVDSEDRPAMGFLYQAIYKAREEMVKRFQKRKKVVDPYLKILDTRWDAQLKKNLHAADQWWESYGCGAPNLQKLAIRVLSQTCSFSCCERNWSIFEHIHSKKRNRLEHQKLNDLVYVHYNLRLQKRNQMRNQVYDPICLDAFEDHSEWILEDSPPFLTPEEIDALRNDLANMSLQSPLDDLDQLDLEDDRDEDGANNSVKNANQNETNQDVAPHLSDEEQLADFEITPWI